MHSISRRCTSLKAAQPEAAVAAELDINELIAESKEARLDYLEVGVFLHP